MCYRIAVCFFYYFVSSLLLIVCLYNALECLALYCTGLGGGGGGGGVFNAALYCMFYCGTGVWLGLVCISLLVAGSY